MTKKIPSEFNDVTPCTADGSVGGIEANIPQYNANYDAAYITVPTVNGALDLSATSPLFENRGLIGSDTVLLTPTTIQSLVQDLSSQSTNALTSSYSSSFVTMEPSSPLMSSSASSTLASDILGDDGAVVEDIDPTVAQAAFTAAQTGLLTPLVKEELRCTIQSKRLKIGKPELVTEERIPVTEKLSEEEKRKQDRRRERNKIAAQKCRNKRKNRMESLEQETDQLERNNKALKRQIRELHLEKQKLTLLLRCHDTSAHNCPQKRKLSETSLISEEEQLKKMFDEIGQNSDSEDTDSTLDGYEMSDNCNNNSNEIEVACSTITDGGLCLDQDIEIMDISVFSEEVVISSE